ncbi:MAG: LamG-like jellyroll fold domain-containing protein [Bacteroidales bacterium]|nr:LamG-like jellyroll fold domain-containing protein [Bacteroidales bacterium]
MKKILFFILGMVICAFLQAQIPTDSLKAHWPFNRNAQDESAFSHHGDPYGAALCNDRFGLANSAFDFDGVDDFIQIPNSSDLNFAESFSISFWFRMDGLGPTLKDNWSIIKQNTTYRKNSNYDIYVDTLNYKLHCSVGYGDDTYSTVSSLASVNDAAWHHGVMVVNTTTMTLSLYFDNALAEVAPLTGDVTTWTTKDVYLGVWKKDNNYFNGAIDDIRMYSKALLVNEIDALFNETKSLTDFSGHISQNTIWTSDMLITGDVWIDQDVTLTIYPGVHVYFPFVDANNDGIGDIDFTINGQLFAQGAEGNSIFFRSNEVTTSKKDWGGITYTTPESGELSTLSYVNIANAYQGFYMDGRNVTFNNCKIYNVFTDALYIESTIYTTSINGIAISDCGDAISIYNGHLTINSGIVSNANGHGLKIDDASATITNVNIYNSSSNGLVLQNNANLIGDALSSIGSGGYGVEVLNAGAVSIDNSYILSNCFFGVHCTNTDIELENCSISDNENGLYFINSNPAISYCCIVENGIYGFHIINSSGEFTNCTISSVMPFLVENASPVVNYNNFNYIFKIIQEDIYLHVVQSGSSSVESISIPVLKDNTWLFGSFYSWNDAYDLHNTAGKILRNFRYSGTDSWYCCNLTSSTNKLLQVGGSLPNQGYYITLTKIKTEFSDVLFSTNTTGIINAQFNYWGQMNDLDALIYQSVPNTVDYSNFFSNPIDSAGCSLENFAPELTLQNPNALSLNPDSTKIKWIDQDWDNNALISLYSKNVSTGSIILIEDDIDENDDTDQMYWQLSTVADGTYKVFGVIDDGVNPPDTSYAMGQVVVGDLEVWIPDDLFSSAGSQIMVPVLVQNAIDYYDILSYQFTVSCNTTIAEPIAVITEGTLSESWTVFSNNTIAGQISVNGFSTDNLVGTDTLVNILFQVKNGVANNTSMPLNFADFVFNEGNPVPVVTDGQLLILDSFLISGSTEYYSNSNPVPGVELTTTELGDNVTVYSDALGDYTFPQLISGDYTVVPSYDESIPEMVITPFDASLTARFALFLITLNNNQQLAADVSGDGDATVYDAALMAQYSVGLITSFPPGKWIIDPLQKQYTLIQNVEEQDYTFIAYGDPSGNWSAPSSKTKIDNTVYFNAKAGEEVMLTIPSDKAFFSFLVKCEYDQQMMAYLSYSTDAALNDFSIDINAQPGNLRLSAYGVEQVNPESGLITLRFIANKDLNNYPVVVSGIIDEEPLEFNTTGVSETVKPEIGEIYPNPAKDIIRIPLSIDKNEFIAVKIINAQGELVKDTEYSVGSEDRLISLNISGLAAGAYYVKIIRPRDEIQSQILTIVK